MPDDSLNHFRAWVIDVLRLVAEPAERQIREVRALGVDVDEIVLQLDDMVHVAGAHEAAGDLSSADFALLTALLDRIEECSQVAPDFYTEDGLSLPEWGEVRGRAALVLDALGSRWADGWE